MYIMRLCFCTLLRALAKLCHGKTRVFGSFARLLPGCDHSTTCSICLSDFEEHAAYHMTCVAFTFINARCVST